MSASRDHPKKREMSAALRKTLQNCPKKVPRIQEKAQLHQGTAASSCKALWNLQGSTLQLEIIRKQTLAGSIW